ncbi:polysaccharide deacetylase family protein [Paenibacillus arenilitoris]|uniref:Polysaccharide deacetylase n=1 Tax=Paenibacillus arenilitoris TaxID=2772299 RepID=A0A927H818_9BACL|nr:polysaccharide deacetylase family protein [Paenibacillus arenilitoris]MBD2871218.1 polysaccharide deacetylase [Paenibacillus arenilitoris]
MRRLVQAAICVMAAWFGLFELGGLAVYRGEAAMESAAVQVLAAAKAVAVEGQGAAKPATVTYYEELPLLVEPAAQETGEQADKQAASGKIVYLTFDDGPSRNTEQVLAILREAGVKATFFVLGEHVKQHPSLAKRIAKEGHSIGNHTFNHRYDSLYGSFAEFASQVTKTDELIYKTTGVRSTLFRAPGGTYGNFDKGYFEAMEAAGYRVHDWNVDSGDSKRLGVPSDEILAAIRGSKLADKLVVLLHDSAGHEESVKALPEIIAYYKEKGYSFAPITEETEPIRFALASKAKWSRAKVTQAEAKKLAQFSEALGREARQEQEAMKEPVLIVHRGEEKLELTPEEYGMRKGSIELSLTKLMDFIGGSTVLDLENGVVEASKDNVHVIWMCNPAGDAEAVQEERIAVPVRSTLQKFGVGIASFVYDDERREVWLTE